MSLTIQTFDDPAVWDLFVLRNNPQALFQSWEWGEVQKRIGVSIDRYAIYDGKTICGVMQVAWVRARRGSFLHVRHGPIIEGSTAIWKAAMKYLMATARARGCWFVRVSPLILAGSDADRIISLLHSRPAAIHRMDGEYVWVLDLTGTEETLLSGMRKTIRYEIRKAASVGVKVYSTMDSKYLNEFFDLYKQTSTRHGFVPHMGIREEFEVFAKKKQAALYLGKHEGKTIAAAIILYFGNQAIYHHGASLSSKVPVSTAVQWEAIKDAKKRGMNVYNFWGIAPEDSKNHPWRGITLFKKGFGGREINYMHAQDIAVSSLYAIPRSVETIRRMLRGYD